MRPRRRPSTRWTPRPALQWVLDAIQPPAIIRNGRMDLLATNQLGRAMHASCTTRARRAAELRPVHLPRRRLAPFLPGLGLRRRHLRRHPAHRSRPRPPRQALHDLVGELSTRSDDFRRRWSTHDVRLHGAGTKRFHHPVVGPLDLAYESVDMIAEPGLTLTIYAAEPASPTAHALDLLASWAGTTAEADSVVAR